MLFKNYEKRIEELEKRIDQLEKDTQVLESWRMFRPLFSNPKNIPVNKAIEMLANELGYEFWYSYPVEEKFYLRKREDENVRVPVSSSTKKRISKTTNTKGTGDATKDNPSTS